LKDFDDFEDEEEIEPPKSTPVTKTDAYENKNYEKKRSYESNRRYEDEESKNDKIIKANKYVNLPTEDVRVFKTEIYFNHDSADRQRRRAVDLLKIIELDKKSFILFEMNPGELSTVYAANMKHVKVQTNEGREEIEIQTDDIDTSNKWTQNPSTDTKECGGKFIKKNVIVRVAQHVCLKRRFR
jgi:hypothetical protein